MNDSAYLQDKFNQYRPLGLLSLFLIVVLLFAQPGWGRFGDNPYSSIGSMNERQCRRELYELDHSTSNNKPERRIPILRRLATALGQQCKMDDERKVLEELLNSDRNLHVLPATESIQSMEALAVFRMQDNRNQEARLLLEEALRLTQSAKPSDPYILIPILCKMAYLAETRHDYTQAGLYYAQALKYYAQAKLLERVIDELEDRGCTLVSVLESYGDVQEKLGRYGDAEATYRHLIAIDESRPSAYDGRLPDDLVRLAGVLMKQHKEKEVNPIYERVCDMCRSDTFYMTDSLRKATINLAKLHVEFKQLEKAETLYRLALTAIQ